MSEQTILVADGEIKYTQPMTVTSDNDITAAPIQVSLGTYDDPGVWQAGVVAHPTPSTAVVKLLVDNTVPPGTYWLWAKLTNPPEVILQRGSRIIVGVAGPPPDMSITDSMKWAGIAAGADSITITPTANQTLTITVESTP